MADDGSLARPRHQLVTLDNAARPENTNFAPGLSPWAWRNHEHGCAQRRSRQPIPLDSCSDRRQRAAGAMHRSGVPEARVPEGHSPAAKLRMRRPGPMVHSRAQPREKRHAPSSPLPQKERARGGVKPSPHSAGPVFKTASWSLTESDCLGPPGREIPGMPEMPSDPLGDSAWARSPDPDVIGAADVIPNPPSADEGSGAGSSLANPDNRTCPGDPHSESAAGGPGNPGARPHGPPCMRVAPLAVRWSARTFAEPDDAILNPLSLGGRGSG